MKQDIVNSIPEAQILDRCGFFVTSTVAGAFALAVQPIQTPDTFFPPIIARVLIKKLRGRMAKITCPVQTTRREVIF